MTEEEWLAATDPTPMLEFLCSKASDRKLRLFGCACCRRVWDYFLDDCCRAAVMVAERYADQLASSSELYDARFEVYEGFHAYEPVADPLMAVCSVNLNRREPLEGFETLSIFECCDFASSIAWVGQTKDVDYEQPAKEIKREEFHAQTILLRDVFCNPFRPVTLQPSWLTSTVIALASGIYEEKAFDRMPILGDALMDAGCENEDMLNHCRSDKPHVRGCWVVDLILSKDR